jgi:hypothetical protein
MQLMAGVKLCTGRPITNHPHFEDQDLRLRTKEVKVKPQKWAQKCKFVVGKELKRRPNHKDHLFIEYHSVCPLVGIGTLPSLLLPAIVPFAPEPKGEGAYLPAGEGFGQSQFRRLEKKLSNLPNLWTKPMRVVCTLQRHNTGNLKQIFPETELRGRSPNFHIHVSVSDLYIPTIGLPILLQENMWTDLGNI